MRLTDSLLNSKSNNFMALRLVLASSVIYSHCCYIVSKTHFDDLSPYLGDTVGSYAVDGFFFLSGFLVYPSLLRLKNPILFLLARLARLWPAFIFCIVLTVIGGLAFTTASIGTYFSGNTFNFIVGNLLFLKAYYTVTGLMCGPDICPVNLSIWSLPFEFRCYLVLAALGAVGAAMNKNVMRVVILVSWIIVFILDLSTVHHRIVSDLPPNLVFYIYTFQRLWATFSLGILAFIDRDKIRLHWWIVGVLLAIQLAVVQLGWALQLQIRALLMGYAVLAFGLLTARRRAVSASWPDYSYGTYLWGTPVMMVIYVIHPVRSPYVIGLETLAGSVGFAALSWHFVESPCLAAFAKFRRDAPNARFGQWLRPAGSAR